MCNYTLAHFIFLRLPPLSPLLPLLPFLIHAPSPLQTALAAETRSSRVSPSWRWRSSGTSAASDVRPATWSSQESTSASECVKISCVTKTDVHQDTLDFFASSFSPDGLNCAFDTLQQFCFLFLHVAGMGCHTVRQITTPSTG